MADCEGALLGSLLTKMLCLSLHRPPHPARHTSTYRSLKPQQRMDGIHQVQTDTLSYAQFDPTTHLANLLKTGVRQDGRSLTGLRPLTLLQGILQRTTAGSALVKIGGTKVVAGVTLQVGQPAEDTPSKGEIGTCGWWRGREMCAEGGREQASLTMVGSEQHCVVTTSIGYLFCSTFVLLLLLFRCGGAFAAIVPPQVHVDPGAAGGRQGPRDVCAKCHAQVCVREELEW